MLAGPWEVLEGPWDRGTLIVAGAGTTAATFVMSAGRLGRCNAGMDDEGPGVVEVSIGMEVGTEGPCESQLSEDGN